MKNCNFCIHENKVFDLNGYEMLPDEDGVIAVFLNGLERRFKIDKMIVWLKESGYNSLFRKPKELPKIKEPKPIKEKIVKVKLVKEPKPKKEKPIKTPKVKKKPKPQYVKVEFDKRTLRGRKIECSNGKIYNSIIEAQKELSLTRSQIWHVCTGKWKHTNNLIFKYI
jgi:hypothetical protein